MARNPSVTYDDDAPKLTKKQLAQFKPAREVMTPEQFAAVTGQAVEKAPRGRPKADDTKVAVSIRLDRDVVEAFKATGKGWQTRVNDVLAKAAPKAPGSYRPVISSRPDTSAHGAIRPTKKKRV